MSDSCQDIQYWTGYHIQYPAFDRYPAGVRISGSALTRAQKYGPELSGFPGLSPNVPVFIFVSMSHGDC